MEDVIELGILGAGGFARELACWLQDIFPTSLHINFYDDTLSEEGLIHRSASLYRLLGRFPFLDVSNKIIPELSYIVGVGDPKLKEKLSTGVLLYPGIVHPSVCKGRNVTVSEGVIICPHATVTTNVHIGRGASVHYNVTIGHDTIIGEYSNICPGANVSGNVKIGNRVYVGAGACIREKLFICDDAVIGMGAIVVKDITEPGVYVGNPAKLLRK